MEKVELGNTGLKVTPICIGAAALGNMPEDFGLTVTDEVAADTLKAVFNSPFNFLDTAAIYGDSERRIGDALRDRGGIPNNFVIATKADRDPVSGDFSGDQVRKSVESSLDRLGVQKLQIVYLHDPEESSYSYEQIIETGGAVEALILLKDQGLIEHLGISAGPPELLERFISETDVFEVMITHNRFNLINREADHLISVASERGVAVVNAAPYAGGIFARGSSNYQRVAYAQAASETLEVVRQIEELCVEMNVPIRAAALQFSTRDNRLASTIAGVVSPEQVEQLRMDLEFEIPTDFWPRLDALLQ